MKFRQVMLILMAIFLITTNAYADDQDSTFEEEKEFLVLMGIEREDLSDLETIFNKALNDDVWATYFDKVDALLVEDAFVEVSYLNEADQALLDALYNAAVMADTDETWAAYEEKREDLFEVFQDETIFEVYTFEMEREFLEEIDLEEDQIKILENLFNQAIVSDTEEAWMAYDDKLEEILPELDFDYTFEEEMDFLKEFGLEEEQIETLKELFNKAIEIDTDEAWAAYEEKLEDLFENFQDEIIFEDYTFEMEREFLEEIDFEEDQIKILEDLFNQAIVSDTEEAWIAYDEKLEEFLPELDFYYTFEEEMNFFKAFGLEEDQLETLKDLFNKAIEIDTEEAWMAYDEKLEEFLPEMDFDYTFEEERVYLEEMGLEDHLIEALEVLFNKALETDTEADWDAYFNLLDENLPSE